MREKLNVEVFDNRGIRFHKTSPDILICDSNHVEMLRIDTDKRTITVPDDVIINDAAKVVLDFIDRRLR